jgi:hypothetical protein
MRASRDSYGDFGFEVHPQMTQITPKEERAWLFSTYGDSLLTLPVGEGWGEGLSRPTSILEACYTGPLV